MLHTLAIRDPCTCCKASSRYCTSCVSFKILPVRFELLCPGMIGLTCCFAWKGLSEYFTSIANSVPVDKIETPPERAPSARVGSSNVFL